LNNVMNAQISSRVVAFTFSVLVICSVMAFYAFAWTEPTGVAPGNNVSTPINTSNTSQTKTGNLVVNALGVTAVSGNSLIVAGGNVGIGTTTPATTFQVYGTSAFMGGNVGIRTTNPSVALEVNGNIVASAPTASNHLATKAYVDAAGGGGCYTNYGTASCAIGWTAVLTGYTTAYVWTYSSYGAAGEIECSSITHRGSGSSVIGFLGMDGYPSSGLSGYSSIAGEPCAICCK
jgi:hypothetical protein